MQRHCDALNYEKGLESLKSLKTTSILTFERSYNHFSCRSMSESKFT